MAERRNSKRTPKQIGVKWENEKISCHGITSDICPGGIFIISNSFLPPKSIIDIELWFNESHSIHCKGEVVWINRGQVVSYPAGFGVQFLGLAGETLDHVLSICDE